MCIEKCRTFFNEHRIDIILVIFLFLVAFGVRILPRQSLIQGNQQVPEFDTGNMMGFDTFWDARWTKHVAQGGGFPAHASVTNYPWGRDLDAVQIGYWLPNALLYKAMGGAAQPFNYGLLGNIMSWMNVIAGALAIVFIYLLGKNLYNRTTGLASGLFLSVMSSSLFYSIYGHAENDGTGFMLFFLSLLLFVLTINKKSWKYGIGTTIALGWLAVTWQAYNVVVMLVGGTIGLYFIIYGALSTFNYYKENEERKKMRKWMLYGCIFVLLSTLIPPLISGYPFLGDSINAILPVGTALLVGSLIELFKSSKPKEILPSFTKPKKMLHSHHVFKGLAVSIIFLIVGGSLFGSTLLTSPAQSVGINLGVGEEKPEKEDFRISQTVAEQRQIQGNIVTRITNLTGRFGILIWLAFLSTLILFGKLFIMPFIHKDFNYHWDILALAFIFISLALLTQRAISMFFLSGAVALGAGYFFGLIKRMIEYTFKKQNQAKKYLTLALFLVLTISFFSHAVTAVNQGKSYGAGVYPEWQETMHWLNEKAETNSVVTAWWDYGHWMNYFNQEKIFVTSDNIKDRPSSVYTTASAFTHAPQCELKMKQNTQQQPTLNDVYYECNSSQEALKKAEKESLSLLKPLHTDYIIIDKQIVAGRTGGKWNALQTIAQPRYKEQNMPAPCFQTLPCQETQTGVTCGGQGGLQFNQQQWNQLKNTKWPGQPLQTKGIDTRMFAKEDSKGPVLYMSGIACGNAFFQGGSSQQTPTLYTFAHRLFFNDKSLQHVEKVLDNDWIVMYKIKNKEQIPHPSNYTDYTQKRDVLKEQPEELPKK